MMYCKLTRVNTIKVEIYLNKYKVFYNAEYKINYSLLNLFFTLLIETESFKYHTMFVVGFFGF